MNKRKRWLIASVIIGAALLLIMVFNLSQNSVYFLTPKEAIEKAPTLTHQTVRVGGMVKALNWVPQELSVNFTLSDLAGAEFKVHYKGAPPDMFKEGGGVVVEGTFSQQPPLVQTNAPATDTASLAGQDAQPSVGLFEAKNLFVKHSEEYKVPKDMHAMNEADLKRSIMNTGP